MDHFVHPSSPESSYSTVPIDFKSIMNQRVSSSFIGLQIMKLRGLLDDQINFLRQDIISEEAHIDGLSETLISIQHFKQQFEASLNQKSPLNSLVKSSNPAVTQSNISFSNLASEIVEEKRARLNSFSTNMTVANLYSANRKYMKSKHLKTPNFYDYKEPDSLLPSSNKNMNNFQDNNGQDFYQNQNNSSPKKINFQNMETDSQRKFPSQRLIPHNQNLQLGLNQSKMGFFKEGVEIPSPIKQNRKHINKDSIKILKGFSNSPSKKNNKCNLRGGFLSPQSRPKRKTLNVYQMETKSRQLSPNTITQYASNQETGKFSKRQFKNKTRDDYVKKLLGIEEGKDKLKNSNIRESKYGTNKTIKNKTSQRNFERLLRKKSEDFSRVKSPMKLENRIRRKKQMSMAQIDYQTIVNDGSVGSSRLIEILSSQRGRMSIGKESSPFSNEMQSVSRSRREQSRLNFPDQLSSILTSETGRVQGSYRANNNFSKLAGKMIKNKVDYYPQSQRVNANSGLYDRLYHNQKNNNQDQYQ